MQRPTSDLYELITPQGEVGNIVSAAPVQLIGAGIGNSARKLLQVPTGELQQLHDSLIHEFAMRYEFA